MNHDARRGLRIMIGIGHVLVQILIVWVVVTKVKLVGKAEAAELMQALLMVVMYLAIMTGVFFSYFTVSQLISSRNLPRSH